MNKMAKQNKPAIRFKGFTDAWEQRKLGDIMNVTSVKRIHQSDWTDSGVRFLRARDIVSASKNEEPDDYLYISKEKYDEYSLISGKVSVGDLLVTGVGTIGVPYLIRNSEPLYFKDGNIIWFQNGTKIDGDFFLYSFFGKAIQDFINESAGIGTVGTYTIESGKKTPISLPEMKEQQQIGAYFRNLDHLITLHQRKYDKLQVLKKAMLEKMFPKNGSSVPEIRFKGFTDAWEQRKLGEIVERITRKNENLESTLPLTISAQYGLIDQNEFFDKRIASKDVSGYFLVKNGEFAYNKSTSSDAPWGAIKRLDRYESGVLSTLYIVFKILDERKTSSDYIVTYYNTDLWHKGIQAIAAEGARNHGLLNVAPADFFETNLTMPKDYAEQQQIGSFFQQLDSLITLHQRELEKLQNIKKSMLEKMFV